MMKKLYRHSYYKDRHQKTVYSAKTILPMIIELLPEIASAIDFGCGVGTWLAVLKEKGVKEIQGIDGPWVQVDLLEIPAQSFRHVDFEEEINVDRKYDLALSLEVAEHLSEEAATRFVESLTNASDYILFSAAIPFQEGSGHVNLQWPDYWAELFSERGYIAFDFVRKKIWNDKQIPIWYRQNILLFVNKEKIGEIKNNKLIGCYNNFPFSLVHPETYLEKVGQMLSVKGSLKLLRKAVRKSLKIKARKIWRR